MDINEARELINSKFIYKSDNSGDSWSILDTEDDTIKGDCEDYSLTFIWLSEDKRLMKFLLAILTMKYIIWYVKSPKGNGHALTYVKENGMYIDNISKEFLPKKEYLDAGYRFVFPFASILALLKLIM